jgi:myo-inositol-1(or 4)-monophosphatase
MQHENLSGDLKLARRAARAAADIICKNFGLPKSIWQKNAGKSLVTDTDIKAESAILEILQCNSPHAILSEETGVIQGENGMCWIIDPLDGTTNFCNALPLFAVSIALFRDNQPLLGVIRHPLIDDEYYAIHGCGAFQNDRKLKPAKIARMSETILFI